ncbi:MAG: PaaI family thioesterase [Hyphomicrobiaceae bacterium]|nr:PaaI family thioesterase [Hyphomicrobiaceae bacterium]
MTQTQPSAAATFKPSYAGYAVAAQRIFDGQGLMHTIGARLVSIAPGACSIELPYGEAVSQQHKYFHGGAIGAIADVAAGCAAFTLMPEGSEVLTVEYKLNLVKAGRPPLLLAEAQVLRPGRTLTVCRAEVHRVDGDVRELCAVLQATMMRLDPTAQS